tara:strand:+ start:28 stop:423 length:396 start_codon:yes stop_codon:yes gene_type:complete
MKEFLFLTVFEVLEIHENQIQLYGGSLGLRDQGLLMAALAQPEATFEGEFLHTDIYSMAGAYLFHVINNHPFIDGNKRVATVSALIFLELNDFELVVDEQILEDIVMNTASGRLSKDEVINFFRKYTSPLG